MKLIVNFVQRNNGVPLKPNIKNGAFIRGDFWSHRWQIGQHCWLRPQRAGGDQNAGQ